MRLKILNLKNLIKLINIFLFIFFYINFSYANKNYDCEFLASIVEEKFDLPAGILVSISNVEAGRIIDNNEKKGWPWTVNHSGDGLFFEKKLDAIKYVEENLIQGDSNMDVGCMQISLKWHSTNFKSIDEAFDPETNIIYAAKFLRKLYNQHGNWNKAIKFYHSSDPKKHQKYHKNVLLAWSNNNLETQDKNQGIVLSNLILPVFKPDLKSVGIKSKKLKHQIIAKNNFVNKINNGNNDNNHLKDDFSNNEEKLPKFILNRWFLVEKFRKEFSNN